jgi:hypothetical protein
MLSLQESSGEDALRAERHWRLLWSASKILNTRSCHGWDSRFKSTGGPVFGLPSAKIE